MTCNESQRKRERERERKRERYREERRESISPKIRNNGIEDIRTRNLVSIAVTPATVFDDGLSPKR